LTGSSKENQFTLTEQSLNEGLAESYAVMKSFITLTATKAITAQQIFSCSRAVLVIAKLMQRLNQSSPSWWSAASSTLIAVKEYTNYARFTSSDLFGDLDRIQAWRDFIKQADELCESLGNTGVESFGTVFPVSDCLSGHPAPSRQARKGTAGGAAAGAGVRWWDGGDVAATLTTESDDQRMPDKANAQLVMQPAHTFKLRGGCEGGGKGYLGQDEQAFTLATTQDQWLAQPVAIQGTVVGRSEHAGPQGSGADTSGAMFTLTKTDVHAVAFGGDIARSLTPVECERLQGFHDGYTAIPWRNKPAAECPDGPRHKALGNSMAVPVMSWIGERINQVEQL
jgi:hypothetical protein